MKIGPGGAEELVKNEQNATTVGNGTVLDRDASTSPAALRKFIVTSSSDGPTLATTSSISTPVSLGSDGVKVCSTPLSRFAYPFVHAAAGAVGVVGSPASEPQFAAQGQVLEAILQSKSTAVNQASCQNHGLNLG